METNEVKCSICGSYVPRLEYCDHCGNPLGKTGWDDSGETVVGPNDDRGHGSFPPGFEKIKKIGRGGMGIAYLVKNIGLKRKDVIKKMKDEIKIVPEKKEAFLREAQRMADLEHENIVRIYNAMEYKGEIFLQIQYIEGRTIMQLLKRKGKLSLKETVSIAEGICKALDFMHAQGTVHKDLKPSNIIVNNKGIAMVMDFGIARDVKDAVSHYSQVIVSGTYAYFNA